MALALAPLYNKQNKDSNMKSIILGSVLIIAALAMIDKTSSNGISTTVFYCNQSLDSLCFREEYNGDVGHCFTGDGRALGQCRLRDYWVPGTHICKMGTKDCPTLYKPDDLRSKAAKISDLVIFYFEYPYGGMGAYCRKGGCYSFNGTHLGEGALEYRNLDYPVCYPATQECPLVASMINE